MTDTSFDAAGATPFSLKTRDPDGTITEHHFEVLPCTKPQFDVVMAFSKRGAALERELRAAIEAGEPLPDADYAALLVEFCDGAAQSTNGPVTFSGLWETGGLPFPLLKRISDFIVQETIGNPPA